ncbi:MAG: hypothetical protein VKL41_04730 [Snowella sp.]|nr:hypothetical protein [Snowella sp.]
MNPKAGINQQLIAQRVGCPPEPKNSYIRDWWENIAYHQNRNAMSTARSAYFTANTNNNFVIQLKNEEDQKTTAFIFYKVALMMDGLYSYVSRTNTSLYDSSANLSKPANAKATNIRIIKDDARTAWGLFIETYEAIPPKERSYVCPINNSDKLIYAKRRFQELSR